MNITEIIFSAAFNLLSIYIDFRFIGLFLSKKNNKCANRLIAYMGVWIVNWGVYFWLSNSILTILSLLIGLFIVALISYEGSLFNKLFAITATLAFGMLVENMTWNVLSGMDIFNDSDAFGSLVSSILFIIILLILERLVQIKKVRIISVGNYINIFIILIGSSVLGEILAEIGQMASDYAAIGLSILCIMDVSTFYFYNRINESYTQKLEAERSKQMILMYENQFSLMEQSQKNIQALRHDQKNHMLLLESYLKNKEYEAASAYIQSITKYIENTSQYVNSGNKEIDAILNYKINEAKRLSCDVEYDVKVPDDSIISEFDVNVLLSNLLDNALEAIQKAEKKLLYIKVKYERGTMLFIIKNSYDGILEKKGNTYITRKKDKNLHGIGLQNIADIVNKYDGEIIQTAQNNEFKTEIILYLSAVQK